MENQVNLDAANYDEFLRVLLILRDICNDVDIREGVVRQRSNDLGTVFEIDLTPIISTLTLPITVLKTKLDIFKVFSGDEVSIITDDEAFTISNQNQKISIKYPELDFIDNKFIAADELFRVIQTNQEDLIMSTQISKKVSDMIRIVTSSFHVNSIQTIFDEDGCKISSANQSKDNFAEFLNNITSNRELNHSANLVITPFIIDHDGDISFEMFDAGNDTVSNVFSTTIGNTNINLYTRASLVENE